MAEPEAQPQTQTQTVKEQDQVEQEKLKYLEFVHVAVLYVVVRLSSVYEYAKEKAGPLKPRVYAVEGTVKNVIGPVYEKFHDIPLELLKFVDHKMDEVLIEMDNHVPTQMRQVTTHALSVAHQIPELVRSMARAGVVDTGTHLVKSVYTKYEPTAKQLYSKYEPIAEHHVVLAWRSVNRVPLFHQVAGIVVPTGVYWAEKYNQTVCSVAKKGFAVAGYMPLVPVAKIEKIFEGDVSTKGE